MTRRGFAVRLAAIAAAGLVLRVVYVVVEKRHDPPQGDGIYYSAQARVIATGGWFADPFRSGREAADHPPMTALLLAPVDWIRSNSVLAQRFAMCVVGAVVVVLLGVLARRLAGDRAALIAAAIAAVYANLWMNDGLPMSETFSAVAIIVALLAAYAYCDRPTLAMAGALGVAIGLAALTRAEMILLAPLVALPLVLTARAVPGRRRVAQLGAVVAAVVVVQVPWIAYNLSRFEKPVLFSTNEGLTYVGANCEETYYGPGTGFWSLQCAYAVEPPPEYDQSEVSSYYREIGIDYARDHLGRVPQIVATRVLRVWSAWDPGQMNWFNQGEGREMWASRLGVLSFWALVPFAIGGGVVLHRRGVRLLPLLALPVIVTLVAAWFYGIVRFRLPAEITVVVLAAAAIDELWRGWDRRPSPSSSPSPAQEQASVSA